MELVCHFREGRWWHRRVDGRMNKCGTSPPPLITSVSCGQFVTNRQVDRRGTSLYYLKLDSYCGSLLGLAHQVLQTRFWASNVVGQD